MKIWLKGGIVLGGIYLVMSLIVMFLGVDINADKVGGGRVGVLFFLIFVIVSALPNLLIRIATSWTYSPQSYLYLLLVIGSITYFILGALIGLIIGKFKKDVKQENRSRK